MQARLRKLSSEIETPKYHTAESAGFDIASAEDITILPGQVLPVRTGLVIQAPVGHFLILAGRSSLAVKKGLKLANGVGIIDRDYCGPADEIQVILHNFTSETVQVTKGERLAQGLFVPVGIAEFVEVENIQDESRGGIGSTGGYNGKN